MLVAELRKALRAKGYKLTVRTVSFEDLSRTSSKWGDVTRIATGEKLPSVFASQAHKEEWKDVLSLLNDGILTAEGERVKF